MMNFNIDHCEYTVAKDERYGERERGSGEFITSISEYKNREGIC